MGDLAGQQIVGDRDRQEDAFRVVLQDDSAADGDVLLLVADGMGGHAGGAVASALAIDAFERHFTEVSTNPRPRQRLREATEAANAAIAARVSEEPDLAGMGCTLVAALRMAERLVWASVGDSILWLLRDGTLTRLNADHSVGGELREAVAAGRITPAEAEATPRKNALRSALTGAPIPLLDVNAADLQRGDVVLVASDGIATLSEAEITAALSQAPAAKSGVDQLLNAVTERAAPRQDNATAVIYRHGATGTYSARADSKWQLRHTAAEIAAPESGGAPAVRRRPVFLAGGTLVLLIALAVAWSVLFRTPGAVEQSPPPVAAVDSPGSQSGGGGVSGGGVSTPGTAAAPEDAARAPADDVPVDDLDPDPTGPGGTANAATPPEAEGAPAEGGGDRGGTAEDRAPGSPQDELAAQQKAPRPKQQGNGQPSNGQEGNGQAGNGPSSTAQPQDALTGVEEDGSAVPPGPAAAPAFGPALPTGEAHAPGSSG